MDAEASTNVDARLLAGRAGILIVWAGTNDIALPTIASAATTYARLVAYCNARRAAGYSKIVVLTTLPRLAGGNVNFESDRQAYNTLIRAGWATFADALADVAAVAAIGAPNAHLDTTYYQVDGVHLNDTGRGLVSPVVKTAIDSVL